MGITGLLPLLKPIHSPTHLRKYSGQSVGVDAYSWLHKGAFGCAHDLCLGIPTTKYVQFCMKRVKLLLSHGIKPVIVFDGGYLPMKRRTEESRRMRDKKEKGLQYLKDGNKSKAVECFQTCVDVTPEMAFEWIKILKDDDIQFVVAPYEADSQLAYLSKNGTINAVISEDSDLLTFGCQKVIYKLQPDGSGIEINLDRLGEIKSMRFWTHERFRQMCILSGCDYLESPPGIGLKTAAKMLAKTDAYTVLIFDQLIKSWKNWGDAIKAPKLPPGYYDRFLLADLTFCHQRVFDSTSQCLVFLTPLSGEFDLDDSMSQSIGPDLKPEIARGIAEGILNPITYEPFVSNSTKPVIISEENISVRSSYLTPPLTQGKPEVIPNRNVLQKIDYNTNTAARIQKVSDRKNDRKKVVLEKNQRRISFNTSSLTDIIPLHVPKEIATVDLDQEVSAINGTATLPVLNLAPVQPLRMCRPARLSIFRDSRLSSFRKKLKSGETSSTFFKNEKVDDKVGDNKSAGIGSQKTLHNLLFS